MSDAFDARVVDVVPTGVVVDTATIRGGGVYDPARAHHHLDDRPGRSRQGRFVTRTYDATLAASPTPHGRTARSTG